MKPEQMNKEISEYCGVKKTTECDDCYGTGFGGSECDHIPCDTCKTTGKVEPHFQELPNYCGSLDAMHEAEKMLPTEDRLRADGYAQTLYKLCGHPVEGGNTWYLLHATAQQRAEAFLRTISAPKTTNG
jgi:hypothetical protein